MIKQKFTYLCLFSFSFLTLGSTVASPLKKIKNEITNDISLTSKVDNANISIQNDGLIYLIPGENKGFTPNSIFKNEASAGYTGELSKFEEFFISLNDKNGNRIYNKNILDLISIQLDYTWITQGTNGGFLEACQRIKFENDANTIKLTRLPNKLSTIVTCQFNVKSRNQNKLKFRNNELKIQLKFNYSYETWLTQPNTYPAVKFANEIKNINKMEKEISFHSPTLFETLDLSSIYNLDIFPHLEKLKIDAYRIHPTYANSFAFPKAAMLKEIVFTRNIIPILPSSSFINLENLEKIWLVGNKIESIQKDAFLGLNKLYELNLDYNPLFKPQNNSFNGLNHLKKLTLSNCHIKDLPIHFLADLKNLNKLDLKFNYISNLNSNLFVNTPSLKELNLSHNNLVNISSESFSFLEKIEKLDLNSNKIKSPILFRKLFNLKYLDLSKNKIEEIQDSSFIYLKSMNEAILSENKITKISNMALTNNPLLTKIDLRANFIEEIPKTKSLYLKDFLLSGNYISQINKGEFDNSPNIETLELSNNKISNISEHAFSYQQKLTSLNLGNNVINYISHLTFSTLPNLNSLWLNNNKIEKIDHYTFYYLNNLNFLAISFNPIQELSPVSFTGLNNLSELWLEGTELTSLPNEIFSYSNLPKLNRILLSNKKFPHFMNLKDSFGSTCPQTNLYEREYFICR
jgi:Leucine-rich repeat (LRR) protein